MTSKSRYRDAGVVPHESDLEVQSRVRLTQLLQDTLIPPEYLIDNLPVYLRRCQLADLLAMNTLYRLALPVPGVMMEFGVLHGRHLAAWTALRGIHEPTNTVRRIIGFDTFLGFPDVSEMDEVSPSAVPGRFRTAKGYPEHLRDVLRAHEFGEQMGHFQRSLVVEGDVRRTVPDYLREHPETIIALAYFDLDLYEPTKGVLEQIIPYLAKGSIIAFDELAHPKWPGETAALREMLDLGNVCLHQVPGREPPIVYLRWNE